MPRRGRRGRGKGRIIVYLLIFLMLASLFILGLPSLRLSTIITKQVEGIKFTFQVDPDVPIKVSVNDWGKTYTFDVKVTITAPSSLRPGAVVPLFQPSSYYAIKNPLSVPAKIEAEGAPIMFSGGKPFAIAIDPDTGRLISPYSLDKYYTRTTTTTRTSTTTRNYPSSRASSDSYVSPGSSWYTLPTYYYIWPTSHSSTTTITTKTTQTTTTMRTTTNTIAKTTQTITATRTTTTTSKTTTKTTEKVVRWEYRLSGGYEGEFDHYYVVVTVDGDARPFEINPGETKTLSFKTSKRVGELLHAVQSMITVNIYVKKVSKYGRLLGEGDSLGFTINTFETIPLSKGLHIQNVVTDAETGKVSYELVNDWITPLEVATGLSGAGQNGKTVTIPAQGKVKVEFVDEQVKTFFSGWHVGRPTTYTKKISACINPRGEQKLFSPTWTCISALAVWRYNVPKVKIILQTTGPGSVEMYADGVKITSGALVDSGSRIRVDAKAAQGYVIGRMEVRSGGRLVYVENMPLLPPDEYVKLLKKRSWSFIADHSRGSEYLVKVSFKRASQAYVYTTTSTITSGTRTYTTKQTWAITPEGEYRVDQNTLAAAKTYIAFRIRYQGYAERDGRKDFPDPANHFDEYLYKAHGSMTITLEAENTADRPVMVKATITLGGKQGVAGQKRIEVSPFRVPAGQRAEKRVSISLEGLWLTKTKGGKPYLPIEVYPMVKWADSPYASWVAGFSQMAIPRIFLDTAPKLWEAKGGEYETLQTVIQKEGYKKIAMAEPVEASDAGVEFKEIVVYKPENSLEPEYALGGTAYTASYQPVGTEVEVIPTGEKKQTIGVIEPPMAEAYDTDPGVVSFIPKSPSKPLGILDWIWKLIQDFWNWLLSLFGIR